MNVLNETKPRTTNGKKDDGPFTDHVSEIAISHGINDKKIQSMTSFSFSSDEGAILGASRSAIEGLISRRSSLDKTPLKIKHNINRVSKANKSEGSEKDISKLKDGETNVQPFHARFQDALSKTYELKKNVSFLGATPSAVEGTASRRMSGAVSAAAQGTGKKSVAQQSEASLDGTEFRRILENFNKKTIQNTGTYVAETGKWKPVDCPTRFAKLYTMPRRSKEKEVEIVIRPTVETPKVHFEAITQPWCGCCMRESFDPYQLPCGHSFCRRCILETNSFLVQDHAVTVRDKRAIMRCPLRHCKAVIPCLPFINGDFRFHLVRPQDKVPSKESKLNLCEQHRLTTYKIRLDVDVTKRKSDDLFDGFNDVVVIP